VRLKVRRIDAIATPLDGAVMLDFSSARNLERQLGRIQISVLQKMASYDTWYNLLTGLSKGAFDVLEVRDSNGSMQNLLTLLGNVSGVRDVQASAPLSVVTNGAVRTLSIDLSAFATSASVVTQLAQKQGNLTAGASITLTGNTISFDSTLWLTATQIAVVFSAYSSTIQMNAAIAAAIVPYSTSVQMNAAIAAAIVP